jgi:PTH1 family peptidyl-tRNA hydrolase
LPTMTSNTSLVISESSKKAALSKFKSNLRGHNGIKSIIATFGTNDFKRLHLGIDRPTSNDPEVVAKYVLSNFTRN